MTKSTDLIRATRKLIALRRAEFRLKQRFESIDFELDVIQPEIKALEEGAARGILPEFSVEDVR